MKGLTNFLIAGGIIVGVGLIFLIVGLALNGWRFTSDFEQREYSATESVTSLDVEAAAGEVYIEFYDGENVTVSYPYSEQFTYNVTLSDGKLTVKPKNVLVFNFFSWKIPDTVIKVPRDGISDFDIALNAGKLHMQSGYYGSLNISVNAGTLNADDLVSETCKCKINAGSLNIKSVSSQSLVVDVSAGSANVKGADCPDIKIDVSAGSANVTVNGEKSAYKITTDCSAGSCNVKEQSGDGSGKRIDVDVSAGSANIIFTNP